MLRYVRSAIFEYRGWLFTADGLYNNLWFTAKILDSLEYLKSLVYSGLFTFLAGSVFCSRKKNIKMMHRFCWLFFSLLYTPFASCYKFPFQDPKLPWDERVNDLVDRLTVEEMVNQSLSVYGVLPPAIERLNVSAYMFNTECLHGYVSRNATAFPQSISLAATFRYCMIWSYE